MSFDFRGFPACACQVAWIPVFETALQRRGIITGPIPIAQLIGTFAASGSTHTGGGASDFWLIDDRADHAVWVARQMGADATWHRLPGWDQGGGAEHVHSVLRGCPHVSTSAAAQIWAVDHNGDGLVGSAPDPGPRPLSGRTWQQGIQWEEDNMPYTDWPQADRQALVNDVVEAVWEHVVREANKEAGVTEQTAEAALKKAANR